MCFLCEVKHGIPHEIGPPSLLDNSLKIIENYSTLLLFKNVSDIQNAEKENKILAVLSVENGNFFTGNTSEDLKIINFLESNHIRFLSMCYNNGSDFCGGAYSSEDIGFTKRGLQIASRLSEHNVILDVSHLNHKSSLDVLKTDLNVIATHSNCYSVCHNPI